MYVDVFSPNVFRSIPQGELTRQEYALFFLSKLNENSYVIDYNKDAELPYKYPMTVGEYIMTHDLLDDALLSIGGQGLLDKVGSNGWLLLLLLELCPIDFDTTNVPRYKLEFARDVLEPMYPIDERDDFIDYNLWKAYYILSNSNLGIMKNQQFTDFVRSLEGNFPYTQQALYSYIVRYMIGVNNYQTDEDFDSDEFIEALGTNEFTLFFNAARMVNPEGELGILFADVGMLNPKPVMLAEWFLQGYNEVDKNAVINYQKLDYTMEELSRFKDTELSNYSGLYMQHIGRADLVMIVYQCKRYMLGAIPFKRDDKLYIAFPDKLCEIIKEIGEDYTTYYIDDQRSVRIMNIFYILANDYTSGGIYDRMRNVIFYNDKTEIMRHIAYMYIAFLIQKGKYGKAYGSPLNRINSYLYEKLLGDYRQFNSKSKYYNLKAGISYRYMYMQDQSPIENVIENIISFVHIQYTCEYYGVQLGRVIDAAKEIWAEDYIKTYGLLKTYVDDPAGVDGIRYTDIQNYIELIKRIADANYYFNEVLGILPKIVVFKQVITQGEQEVPQEVPQEEGEFEGEIEEEF